MTSMNIGSVNSFPDSWQKLHILSEETDPFTLGIEEWSFEDAVEAYLKLQKNAPSLSYPEPPMPYGGIIDINIEDDTTVVVSSNNAYPKQKQLLAELAKNQGTQVPDNPHCYSIQITEEKKNFLRTLLRTYSITVTKRASEKLKNYSNIPASPAYESSLPKNMGIIDLTPRGRVLIKSKPSPTLGGILVRIPGVTWSDAEEAWTAPLAKLSEIASIGEEQGLSLTEKAATKLADMTAPFNYDGTMNDLKNVPLTAISLIDEKKAINFEEFGVTNVYDLLMLAPRRYLDRSNLQSIRTLRAGTEAAFIAKIKKITVDHRKRMVRFEVNDGTASISLTYFNAIWQAKRFKEGDTVIINGKVEEWVGSTRRLLQMNNPMIDPLENGTLPIIPIYPQSAKSRITTWEVHRAVKEALLRTPTIKDALPQEILEKQKLVGREHALKSMHLPSKIHETYAARERLAFDELFHMQAALLLAKQNMEATKGVAHALTHNLTSQFINGLPFPLTNAQKRTWEEISQDLAAPSPMHRLLQGDVGAGKTVIACLTLLGGIESGYQGALMAPTEILATQLYQEIKDRLSLITVENSTPLNVALLTNKVKGKARIKMMEELANGQIHLIVGTHALLVDDVEFSNLGIVVVDEQHRFGVEQRAKLREKGKENITPDMLVMTATPIPRTSAMTVFGDLDVSILDELPPGRTPIVTSWIDESPVLDALFSDPWVSVRKHVEEGHQAYVVCPLVEESEKLQVANATETFQALQEGALSGLKLGLVHGQQKTDERNEIMEKFRAGELDILVATTVIEVGVNVPNATIMVILDSGRFGIAQLHQLRGRVGRGIAASECVLVGRCVSSESRERMKALCASTDGFYLSEVDLELRGHGSLLGTQQSGVSDLKVADLSVDKELLVTTRDIVQDLLRKNPGFVSLPELRAEILSVLGSDVTLWLGKS